MEKSKIKVLGYLEKGTGAHMSNLVYDIGGISPCVMASLGVKQPGIFILVKDNESDKYTCKTR